MSLANLARGWLAFVSPSFGGGGGGGSNSESNTTTTNTDKRQVVDGNSVGVSSEHSTVHVTTTDYGSVNKAIDLAALGTTAVSNNLGQVLTAVDKNNAMMDGTFKRVMEITDSNFKGNALNLDKVLNFATQAIGLTKENINLVSKSADQIGDAYQTSQDSSTGTRQLATTGMIVVGAVAAVAAVMALKSRVKG